MLTQQQIEKFKRDGFVKGSKVLSDEQVEILRTEIERVIEVFGDVGTRTAPAAPGEPVSPVMLLDMKAGSGHPVWQIVNIWEASEPFKEFTLFNANVIEEVAQIMEAETAAREVRLFHDQIVYKPALTGGVNMWHQDSPLWPVLKPNDVELSAWIALDNVDVDNGSMSMVPGSHRWGDNLPFLHSLTSFDGLPEAFEGHEIKAVPCPVAKGEIHFHHPLTWHGSPANTSTRQRRAIALHFMNERAIFASDGHHPMKPFIGVADGEKVQGESFPLVWTAP